MNILSRIRSLLHWRRLLKFGLYFFAVFTLLVVGRAIYAFRDRMPGYQLALSIPQDKARQESRPLQVGFARVKITPDLTPGHPVWLAGFSQHRAATSVHDDLWAVAAVVDDGWTRVGIVALDAIGFFQDDVIQVRRDLPASLKITYTVIHSTHNHSTPDLMGLWGSDYLHTGVDPAYRKRVMAACVSALTQAAESLQPARVAFHEIPTQPDGLVSDTRKPIVFDSDIRVMQFVSAANGGTMGSIVGWGNHPETVWGDNTEITSDFCGYLRDALEMGVTIENRRVLAGVGGIHMFVNGAVGGLMSTTPGTTVRDPFLATDFKEPSHQKARAVGHQLANRVLPVLHSTNGVFTDRLPIGVQAQSVELKLENKGYYLAGFLGLVERGHVKWGTLRSEVAIVTLGDASIACVPGEIYPEIVNGGIENPPGADFQIEPLEVPPLRELMPGKLKFVFGLANDEIGYLLPKSQWDEKAPYHYGAKSRPYGEINSVGPDAGTTIYRALKLLCLEARRQVMPGDAPVASSRE